MTLLAMCTRWGWLSPWELIRTRAIMDADHTRAIMAAVYTGAIMAAVYARSIMAAVYARAIIVWPTRYPYMDIHYLLWEPSGVAGWLGCLDLLEALEP